MIFESIVPLNMPSVEKQHSKSDRMEFLIKMSIEYPEKSKFMIIFNYHYNGTWNVFYYGKIGISNII